MCLGIPGKINKIYEADGLIMGMVDYNGALREVCLSTIQDPVLGDYVMVHAGFAISKMDEQEALKTIRVLDEVSDTDDY